MQTPNNLRKSSGILARGTEVNALIDHLKFNAPKLRGGGLGLDSLVFPAVPIIISDPLTIDPNPDDVRVYSCETQLPDYTYPPHLQNLTHNNNISGEVWDYRLLSQGMVSGPQLQPGTVEQGTLWGYNEDAKRYVFVLIGYPAGAQKCRVKQNGVDPDGYPTYDIYDLLDVGFLNKINDDPIVTENYHNPAFTYIAGKSGTYQRDSDGDIWLDVPNEYPLC